MTALADLGLTIPILAAPMAGGPTTPDLVVAATEAGSLGFVAGGYKTAEALAAQIDEVRARTARFGVNLFAPNPVPVDPDAYRAYAALLQEEGERYGLDLAATAPREDDDEWLAKIDLLTARPVPVVSFTFGIPDAGAIAALRRAGSLLVQSVTSVEEAVRAADAGVDALALQGWRAGGHSAGLTPAHNPAPVELPELVGRVRAAVGRPVVAAGGLARPADVRAALAAGAEAVMVGTALLRTPESGVSAPYRQALTEAAASGQPTMLTRAFTGRPARGLVNRFMERFEPVAPLGYPAVHHLTSPLRRAAAAAGDASVINLWAGTGHRHGGTDPAAAVLTDLAQTL